MFESYFLKNTKINKIPKESNLATDKPMVYGAIFSKAKKGISPVVATSLLLVVAVSSVVFFQGWFSDFSSSVLVDIESDSSSSNSAVRVEGVVNDNLYLKTLNDASLDLLVVKDNLGNEICSFNNSINNVSSAGLVGHWTFDDNSKIILDKSGNGNDGLVYGNSRLILDFEDNTANDKTVYSNNGTLFGGINYNSNCGLNGGCYEFDGNDDKIVFSGSKEFLNTFENSSMSWSVWFKTNQSSGFGTLLDTKNIGQGTVSGISAVIYHGKFLSCVISDGDNFYSVNADINLSTSKNYKQNDWNLMTCVLDVDTGKLKIYLNGENSATIRESGKDISYWTVTETINVSKIEILNSVTSEHDFTIGDAAGITPYFFNGSIDEVGIYSKALDDGDVRRLYESKKSQFLEFKNGGLEFDGIDDFVEVGDVADLTGDMSLVLKTNINYIDGTLPRIISKGMTGAGTPAETGYGFRVLNSTYTSSGLPEITFQLSNSSSDVNRFGVPITEFNNKDATIISNVNNLGNADLFINNKLLNSNSSMPFGDYSTNMYLSFGNFDVSPISENSIEHFKGRINEVYIFDRNLTLEEIKFLSSPNLNLVGSNLNKLDLSSCNLEKGKKYDVLTGSKDGLNEVSVIIK